MPGPTQAASCAVWICCFQLHAIPRLSPARSGLRLRHGLHGAHTGDGSLEEDTNEATMTCHHGLRVQPHREEVVHFAQRRQMGQLCTQARGRGASVMMQERAWRPSRAAPEPRTVNGAGSRVTACTVEGGEDSSPGSGGELEGAGLWPIPLSTGALNSSCTHGRSSGQASD